jgi:hypothetical protein
LIPFDIWVFKSRVIIETNSIIKETDVHNCHLHKCRTSTRPPIQDTWQHLWFPCPFGWSLSLCAFECAVPSAKNSHSLTLLTWSLPLYLEDGSPTSKSLPTHPLLIPLVPMLTRSLRWHLW